MTVPAMMSAAILFLSTLALLMFFVAYCRSVIGTAAIHILSKETRDVAGISAAVTAKDFLRVTSLLRLCPGRVEARSSFRAIGVYYRILSLTERWVAHLSPSLGAWAEEERASCAYYAVLILDRKIAVVLNTPAEQAGS